MGGCRLYFQFGAVKLLDFAAEEKLLEASDNPFALTTRAHLAMLRTREDASSRLAGKIRLIRELYERGMSRDDVLQLFRLIDWMMEVPAELECEFKQEAEQIEREMHMPYVTSVERLAKQEGQAEMLLRALTRQYGVALPESLVTRIRSTTDSALLEGWLDLMFEAATLEEFQQRMQS